MLCLLLRTVIVFVGFLFIVFLTSCKTFSRRQEKVMLQQNKPVITNVVQQRKFYAPFTVSQQVENVPDVSDKEESSIRKTVAKAVNVSDISDTAANVSVADIATETFTKARTLGGLEHMYTVFSGHGAEIICLMATVETVYQISEDIAHTAFMYLLLRHPLFRMYIQKDPSSAIGELQFMEMKPLLYDFHASDRTDWLEYLFEEACRPFSGPTSPLIRFRLINSTPIISDQPVTASGPNEHFKRKETFQGKYKFRATFLYVVHHSIMDGGYILWSFQEYINFVDAVATKQALGKIKELPMFGPVEDIFSCSNDNYCSSRDADLLLYETTKYSVKYCEDSTYSKILNDYKNKFATEIQALCSRIPEQGCITFHLSKAETKTFIRLCQSMKCSPVAVMASAAIFSFLDLIYAGEPVSNVEMPFEYMIDLRRFPSLISSVGTAPHFPGVATVHVPLIANLDLSNGRTANELLQFAKTFEADLSKQLTPDNIMKIIRDNRKYLTESNRTLTSGKSPYTLCISNMGKLDGVISGGVSQRVHLAELQGYSTIIADDMPIFFVTTFLLNGHASGNVSFCNSYTSVETSKRFLALFKKYLTSVHSKM